MQNKRKRIFAKSKPWKCRGMESMESQRQAFHPSHTPWKSLRGFPHYHGYDDGYHLYEDRQRPPNTRNQSHSRRKGLVNHVPGLKRKGCPGTLTPVVPPKSNRVDPWRYDRALYKKRNEIERLFRRLKGYRRIFSRFEKLDCVFLAFLYAVPS